MRPENRVPAHPGEILLEEFLIPMGVTQVAFAEHIGVPVQRVNQIVRGKRGVSAETAWLFAHAFGTTPDFWMNLQANHDLNANKPSRRIAPLSKTRPAAASRPRAPAQP